MTIKVNRPEGTVNFCTDLAIRGEWEDAVENLERVRQKEDSQRQLTDVADAARAVQTLEARMRASTLRFRLRGLPRKRWQELGEEHPPRDGNSQDQAMGVNTSTFFDAVLQEKGVIFGVNKADTDEVVDFDATAEWNQLADDMTDGQWKEFADEVLRLNRAVTTPPFSRTASLLTQDSGETSEQPASSG
jgi:hypothetical protein